jgi:hypothetical protein
VAKLSNFEEQKDKKKANDLPSQHHLQRKFARCENPLSLINNFRCREQGRHFDSIDHHYEGTQLYLIIF